MICFRLALVACALMPAAALAQGETTYQTQRYGCERGVEIVATYVNASDLSLVVLNAEGRQITLERGESASGVRYVWPSDGSNYVWWTKGSDALLLWHDGTNGEERIVYEACRAR